MENKATVKRANINDYLKELPKGFSVSTALRTVAALTPVERQFCFEASFPFGTDIIVKGRSCLLDPKYQGANWSDSFRKLSAKEVHEAFRRECDKNTDHPLSLVLENEVEVYSSRKVSYKDALAGVLTEELFFPLNRIGVSGWFGTFGTNDIILAHEPKPKGGRTVEPAKKAEAEKGRGRQWGAVAGRACLSFNFPPPVRTVATELREGFPEIFKHAPPTYNAAVSASATTKDRAIRIVGDFHGVVFDHFRRIVHELDCCTSTRVLILPDHYFIIGERDSPKLKAAKRELQRTLLITGWGQSEQLRDTLWRQREARELGEATEDSGADLMRSHLLEVVTQEGFCLRPVTQDDPVIYEAWKALCDQWLRNGLWGKCFPLLLTYGRGVPKNGLPAVVLAQHMAENVSPLSEDDLKRLDRQTRKGKRAGDDIAEKVTTVLKGKGHADVECTYYDSCIKMTDPFWETMSDIIGDEVVHTRDNGSGQSLSVQIRTGKLRKAKGGSFKAFFDQVFIIRKKVDA